MNRLPPIGSPEREFVIERLMTDTGFYCRYVLGMDTDRDENGNAVAEVGKSGVRDHGPHQQVIEFLDNTDEDNQHRLLLAPRYSYKSSMIRGFIQRKIIAHPNISILLFMAEDDMAVRRCLEIRDDLENNPILKELFPNMKGDRLWQQSQFITGLRTDKSGDSPTLFCATPRKVPTGSRPNIVIFDDIVIETALGDKDLERGRKCIERSLALGSRGCVFINIGTPKHFADAHHWCMELPGWKKLTHLDVGYDIVVKEDKTMDLSGKGTWPNLSKDFLRTKLKGGTSFFTFMSEYKLQVVSGTFQAFHRRHFQPVSWSDTMRDLTGYLLTDIAQGTPEGATSSELGKGALNVLMYVGVDARNRVTILDLEVGRWNMMEYTDRYLNMLDRWSGRVNHRVEVWEQVNSNTAYASFVGLKAKDRGRRISIAWQRRTGSDASKQARILSTQGRFQSGDVFVCNTVPRTWIDEADARVLWDPEGYNDIPNGVKLPAGDLVEQFVRFPNHPLRDIPDAYSLVESVDKESGQRVCFHVKPVRLRLAETEQRQAETDGQMRMGSSSRFYDRIRNQRKRHL